MYGKSLENELISETSGSFKRLLVSLCMGGRDESGVVDEAAATRDATELLRAGELRVGTDESTFNMVFCQRNFAQIKLVGLVSIFHKGKKTKKAFSLQIVSNIFSGLRKISANDIAWLG